MRTSIYACTLITVALFAAGCGSSSGGGSSAASGFPSPVPTTTPTPGPGTGGSTAVTMTSETNFDNYLGWTANAPTNLKVLVNVSQISTYPNSAGGTDTSFGGQVTISFTDASNNNYADSFSSMLQSGPNTVNSEAQNNEYNLLSTGYPGQNGLPAYHGFFQGATYCSPPNQRTYVLPPGQVCYGQIFGGAIILVVDSLGFNADGAGATTASGSIWFKNFVNSMIGFTPPGPLPGTNCWFVSAGPYQCREWTSGGGVATKRALLPDGTGGFQELGTFTGLPLTSSFNGAL